VALCAAFEARGGVVRTGSPVGSILCEGERVRGVRLADGTELRAPIVVSACDPRRTFVEWLSNPPVSARSLVDRWRSAPVPEGYESKIDAVIDEVPFYRQSDARVMAKLGVDPLTATTVVSPSVAGLAEAHQLMGHGRVVDRPILLANVPSALDPTMQPATGQHVFSLEVLFTPYSLAGGWADSMEPARWLAVYGGLVQDGWTSHILRSRAMTPDRYESEFHMPRGHATSFGGGPLAAVLGRPRELTRYTTPIAGLYLTGAATYPGAGVWGASGRNAANVILAGAG
jgi:phytoene dehydrogenase-like protein